MTKKEGVKSKSDNNGTYTLNSVNQITNIGYSYDNNGNLTADPSRTYEWDAANRLTAINYTAIGGRTEFTYGGLGRRVIIVEKNPGMTMTAQAPNTSYTSFSSPSFTLSAGTYTLTIQGLNPNGGDNTMFVDAVKLNGTLVPNGGFETPSVGGGYTYNPTGASWNFLGGSGVTGNGSAFTSSNPSAPEGTQVGFIQGTGYATQSLSLSTGSYTLTFYGAQRGNGNASYQKTQITLQTAAPITSTKQFIWIGNRIAEERDANNNVLRRFYPQGEQISGTSYYYTRDHLGSIREFTDSTATIRARYDYDPYGYRAKVSGDLDAEFGYTGHYFHQPSGLNLALYRAYDSGTGRWLSRDPLKNAETSQGANLYTYVINNPINTIDPLGLRDIYVVIWNGQFPYGAFGYGGVGHVAAVELDGRVILSQFPDPHAMQGANTTLSYPDTIAAEGRFPDSVYKIFVPDDAGFDGSVADSLSRPYWYWAPDSGNSTNCTRSVDDALNAGGVPVPWDIWPSDWPILFNAMPHPAGAPWSITRVPVNLVPYRL